jgi:hypothetical protein
MISYTKSDGKWGQATTAGQEYTSEVYTDGMEMFRGVGLWQ